MASNDGSAADAAAAREEAIVDKYVEEHGVEQAVAEIVHRLLAAKPEKPRQWLLDCLEKEISDESDDLAESDLHRLFTVTQKITSEIMPSETINIVICETLNLLSCDRVSLFVFDRKMSMLRLYASNLAAPIMVSPGQGIVGTVFSNKEVVNIADCYQDPRFDRSFDVGFGYVTKTLLAVPIVDFDGAAVGVLQAINKLQPSAAPPLGAGAGEGPGPGEALAAAAGAGAEGAAVAGMPVVVPFQRIDEKILSHLTPHVSIAMRNAEVYREAISTSERSMGLLNTIQSLSFDLGGQSLLLTITMHATKIVSSQRATVFLVDESNQQLWSVSTDTGQEIRIPKGTGIAGQCCSEAKVINIPDAYADSRFNQEIDRQTGFKTQSILAIPLMETEVVRQARLQSAARTRRSLTGSDFEQRRWQPASAEQTRVHHVIGVIQMINKVSYDGVLEIFDDGDIEVMELFAKFVSPKLANSTMVSRRPADLSDKKEAELALTQVPVQDLEDRAERTWKRLSATPLDALAEEGEVISPH